MPRGNPNFVKKTVELVEPEPEEVKDNKCYFFSSPKRFQVHFKDEERYHNGDIKQMATVIEFRDNMHATADPDEIKCIRGCKSFGVTVKECKDMGEVESFRQARTLQRAGKMAGVLADDNLTVEEAPIVAVAGTQS